MSRLPRKNANEIVSASLKHRLSSRNWIHFIVANLRTSSRKSNCHTMNHSPMVRWLNLLLQNCKTQWLFCSRVSQSCARTRSKTWLRKTRLSRRTQMKASVICKNPIRNSNWASHYPLARLMKLLLPTLSKRWWLYRRVTVTKLRWFLKMKTNMENNLNEKESKKNYKTLNI